jgi:muramoyltetrapeptide carboxypeptidase
MSKIPSFLKPGDTIGIVCPAGFMPFEKAKKCIDVFQRWGYKVKTGKTLGSTSPNYFSGTDEERLNDFQQMMDDDDVNAVLCGRGGYGVGRIIEQMNFKKFKKKPKWIIGFSDITILHSHIYSNYRISTIHAPMAAAFNVPVNDLPGDEGSNENEFILSLKNVLEGKKIKYSCDAHEFNRVGKVKGELIGGNLALLAHLVGTNSDIKTKNKILFLEDIGEQLYNIDRMMYQLKRSGKLSKLAGLIIGGFNDTKDTERPFGQTAYEIIRDVVKEYEYPVCFNFPVSHEKENYALKLGMEYKLKIWLDGVSITE